MEGGTMVKQKGQAVVEFALVLPFFLMLVFGIMFAGLLYSDYLTMSNVARESARAAAIQGSDSYDAIVAAGKSQKLFTDLYGWDSFTIVGPDTASTVTVTLTLKLKPEYPGAGFVKYMLPDKYTIVYSMYKEPSS